MYSVIDTIMFVIIPYMIFIAILILPLAMIWKIINMIFRKEKM